MKHIINFLYINIVLSFLSSLFIHIYADTEAETYFIGEDTTSIAEQTLPYENEAIILAIALCVLSGIFISFYIIRKMKTKYR